VAVYDRTWRGYEGALTPSWSRFLVLPRYAIRDIFSSKLFTMFIALSFLWPIVSGAGIYIRHNLKILSAAGISADDIFPINAGFFLVFLVVQGFVTYLLALIVGPSLLSPDLVNNALPLYLCRPFSRIEYLLGKGMVLILLLSATTWAPGLVLVGIQATLEKGWLAAHPGIPGALFLASWIWILLLTLLSLALSAYVKRRALARLLMLVVFFLSSGFAEALNGALDTEWGYLFSLPQLIRTVWAGLFPLENRAAELPIPLWAAWLALFVLCAICFLLLRRKLRAYELVR